MSPKSKQEYTAALRARYTKATKDEKNSMLNEFCAVCGYNRKYAIRLLNSKPPPSVPSGFSRRGRKRIYVHPLILKILRNIWVATNLPCSKRLKVIFPLWLPYYILYTMAKSSAAMLAHCADRLPKWLLKRISLHSYHWEQKDEQEK